MESGTRIQENQNPSPLNSPHTNYNVCNHIHTPIPISRSDNNSNNINNNNNNPYPTTFVQADTSTFKQVVQMLTGSTDTAKQASSSSSSPSKIPQDPPLTPPSTSARNFTIPPIKNSPKRQLQQNSSFKLYERRNTNLKNTLIINTLMQPSFSGFSPRKEILSPSLLDFPKLTLSPVTPLNEDTFNKSSPSVGNSSSSSEEERAIAEKGFYLHPSPISTPRDCEPQLLSLFPVTSPKASGS